MRQNYLSRFFHVTKSHDEATFQAILRSCLLVAFCLPGYTVGEWQTKTGKKKFWQFGFTQSVAASLVAAALWTLGSALASFAWARLIHAGTIIGTTINVSLLLIGAYVMGLGVYLTIRWLPRRTRPKSEWMAFRIFVEDADLLLRLYRRLGFDDPENTRLPLNHSSWPNFNPPTPWTYTQISLFCLSTRFDWLVRIATRAFAEMGWNEPVELFSLPRESTVMVDLVPALENFRELVQTKIALETKYVAYTLP